MKRFKNIYIVSICLCVLLSCACASPKETSSVGAEALKAMHEAKRAEAVNDVMAALPEVKSKLESAHETPAPQITYQPSKASDLTTYSAGSNSFDPNNVPLQTVDSSCFSRVGYDTANKVLVVVFKESGKKYAYYDFSSEDWASFINADSLGTYYNAYIKGLYTCEKIG